MTLAQPQPGEYAEAYAHYLGTPVQGDVLTLLETQAAELGLLFRRFSDSQALHRYAPGKWSLKDLLQHLTDTERMFTYRCLRIGRGDTAPLPGFDENAFAAAAQSDGRPLGLLLVDFQAARAASLALFRSLPEAAWLNPGTTNGRQVTARCMPYFALAHAAHHLAVVRERDLPGLM